MADHTPKEDLATQFFQEELGLSDTNAAQAQQNVLGVTRKEKQQLLSFMLSNSVLNEKTPEFSLKQPFSSIQQHASHETRSNWLGR